MTTPTTNDHLVMVSGESASGKSAGLKDIENPEGVLYLNCEAGKKLPFRSKFIEKVITDPYQVYEAFDWANSDAGIKKGIHTIVIDTQTYLMDMFESLYIINSANGQKAWGDYAQFFQNLMQQYVAKSRCNVIFLAHSTAEHNEAEMIIVKKVPVKGSLKGKGIESFFSTVLMAKKIEIKKLKDYANDLLTITPLEEALGYKHVFQTQVNKETVHDRIRGPMGMWTVEETYIDNNIQLVINRLHEYYSGA